MANWNHKQLPETSKCWASCDMSIKSQIFITHKKRKKKFSLLSHNEWRIINYPHSSGIVYLLSKWNFWKYKNRNIFPSSFPLEQRFSFVHAICLDPWIIILYPFFSKWCSSWTKTFVSIVPHHILQITDSTSVKGKKKSSSRW